MKIKILILSTILLFPPFLLAIDVNQLLNNVRKDLISLSADFKQYEVDPSQRVSEVSTGKMWLNAPNQFKWEYFEPAPQLIVANGQKVWIFDEDLDQVTIKQQDSTKNPIYVLLNKELTETNYTVENWEEDNNQDNKQAGIDWISLTPKVAGDEIKQVWLGIVGNELKVLKLKNQLDNIVVFEFSNSVKNPELSEDFFTFDPPEGIDIIRDAMGL